MAGADLDVPTRDSADFPSFQQFRALRRVARCRDVSLGDEILLESAGGGDFNKLRRLVPGVPLRVRLALGPIDDFAREFGFNAKAV